MTDWNKIRNDFPITEKKVYFQSAGISPIPIPVFDALMNEYKNLHLHGEISFVKDLVRLKKLYEALAEILNTDSDNITFTQNTSLAMSILALSFKNQIKAPFNIVSMHEEFPASSIAFEYQGIEMRYVKPEDSRYPIESILPLIDKNTFAVVTSHVQYSTGFRQDILALGNELKSRGILYIVNATQSFPYYAPDIKAAHIDALTASLHKWGLTGNVGSLFITTQEFRDRFPAPWAGWLSVDTEGKGFIYTAKNQPFHLHASAKRYEFGSFNIQTLLAFQKSLDYIKSIGLENIRQRLLELTDYLIQGLKKHNIKIISPVLHKHERSAIISFTLGEQNHNFVKKCEEKNICLSLRDGNIRASVNIFNNFADIDRLLNELPI